jgi:RNA polymerase sigma-70 factor, ECF subfamily
MTHPTANPLVTALASGRPEAFAALYDRLGRSLLRVARLMLHGSADAEDAVQDTFVELARRRDRLEQVRDLDAYVFAMLRHAIGRRLQRQRRGQQSLKSLLPPATDKPDICLADELTDALKALPAEQREVIALKIDGGLTFAQIGAVLNLSPNTAASRYRYALEKLRVALE